MWSLWKNNMETPKNINKSNFSPWWAFNKYVFGTKWRLFVTWIYFRSKQIKLAFLKRRWGRERVSFTCSFSWSDTQTWKNLFLADGLTNYRMATWRHIFNHIYFFHLISNFFRDINIRIFFIAHNVPKMCES